MKKKLIAIIVGMMLCAEMCIRDRPTILPFLSTSIVVGNAMISEAYLPAALEESIDRLRYLTDVYKRQITYSDKGR